MLRSARARRGNATRFPTQSREVGGPRVPVITAGPTWTDEADGTATVTWTTDIGSDSRVNYGLTKAYGSTEYSATLVTAHSVTITAAAETYQFNTSSINGQGAFTTNNQSGVITGP